MPRRLSAVCSRGYECRPATYTLLVKDVPRRRGHSLSVSKRASFQDAPLLSPRAATSLVKVPFGNIDKITARSVLARHLDAACPVPAASCEPPCPSERQTCVTLATPTQYAPSVPFLWRKRSFPLSSLPSLWDSFAASGGPWPIYWTT